MKQDEDKYMRLDDFHKFIKVAKDHDMFWYYFFKTQALLGGRIGEMTLIQYNDIDLEHKKVYMPTLKQKFKKGRTEIRGDINGVKRKVISIAVSFEHKEIENYFKIQKGFIKEPYYFKQFFPVSRRSAIYHFKKICKLAGLIRDYSSHSIRHMFGYLTYQSYKELFGHGDLVATAKRMRHRRIEGENPTTTEMYMHLVEDEERKLAKRMGELIG